ncbi:MAG: tetratricopeptide repeat protein [Terracidiphilus sp.]
MSREAWKLIEKAIQDENWIDARRLIKAELRSDPKDHWLMSRLALTYYEQKKYKQALYWDAMALQVSPNCPLAIWGYAGTLEMLGRQGESLALFRWLLSWGEEELAYGECGEGIRKARSLIADCHYRIAHIWEEKRQWKRAVAEYEKHLSSRKMDASASIQFEKSKLVTRMCFLRPDDWLP